MRKKDEPKRFVSSNSSTARNANFQVTVDFSTGPRGAVEIRPRTPTANYPKGPYPKGSLTRVPKKKP
jgi:hypothetical protein